MLASWGDCDKIHLVVIARIKLFVLMRGGVHILVNSLTFETSLRWFLRWLSCLFIPLNMYSFEIFGHLFVSFSGMLPARQTLRHILLGLPLVTAALATVVPFSEHFTDFRRLFTACVLARFFTDYLSQRLFNALNIYFLSSNF